MIELARLEAEQTAKLRFVVEDTGVGLTGDAIQKIFDPFEQVGDKQHQRVGTGLGLTISQNLAQMMGSQIQVESEPGQGSKFWLDIILPTTPRQPEPEQQAARKINGYKGQQRTIMVVDDELYNRTLIGDLLTPLGFEVIEAVSGQEALTKNDILRPDFILMDLRMTEMSGLETIKLIRQSHGNGVNPTSSPHDVVIIAASASAFDKDREESRIAGSDGFLAKPIKPDELLELLEVHLNIEWIYDGAGDVSRESGVAETFVIPPPDEMQILLDLANRGKLRRILDRANHLRAINHDYKPFANRLTLLAQNFEERAIIELIKKHVD